MWQKLGQLHDEEGFLPWAKVILRFKCLSLLSAVRRHRHLLSDDVLQLIADEAEAMDAEQVAAIHLALNKCLSQFSRAHQELLLAPHVDDGNVKRLADEAGKTVNSLYKLLARLREKLAGCIRGQLQADLH